MLRSRPSPAPAVLLTLRDRAAGTELARLAAGLGWSVQGPFAAAREALACLEDGRPSFAVVDAVLRDGTALPLVSALRRLGLRFVLVDGFEPGTGQVRALASDGRGWANVPLAAFLVPAGEMSRQRRSPAAPERHPDAIG